jgi:GNAT superfamily N-acetyltransferase
VRSGTIVRRGSVADAAALAGLQDVPSAGLADFTRWVTDHERTHLPFVAEVDSTVVGAAWLLIAERVPRAAATERSFGDIQSVMVSSEHRGRGIGTALIDAILAEARARGLSHVTVHSGRRAVDFYLREGFGHHRQMLLWEPAERRSPGSAI